MTEHNRFNSELVTGSVSDMLYGPLEDDESSTHSQLMTSAEIAELYDEPVFARHRKEVPEVIDD